MCPDASGRLWVSAGDEDLFVREGAGIQAGVTRGSWCESHSGRTSAGRIWFGTTSGLFFADRNRRMNPVIQRYCPDAMCGPCPRTGRGTLWAGPAMANCIASPATPATAFRPADDQEPGAIWSVLADQEGTVWVGTFRGGIVAVPGWTIHALQQEGRAAGQCHLPDSRRWPGQSLARFASGHFSRCQIGVE